MFSRLKIGIRVLLSLAAIVAMMFGLAYYNAIKHREADGSDTALLEENVKPLGWMGEFELSFYRGWVDAMNASVATESSVRSEYISRLMTRIPESDEFLAKVDRATKDEGLRQSVAGVASDWATIRQGLLNAMESVKAGQSVAVFASISKGELKTFRDGFNKKLVELNKALMDAGQRHSDKNTISANDTIRASYILSTLAALLGAFLGVLAFRSINACIRGMQSQAERLPGNGARV